MKFLLVGILAGLIITSYWLGVVGTSKNLDYVKLRAPEIWKSVGFEIYGYEGYLWGSWGLFGYGGAKVWYNLRKVPDNGIIYSGYLQRWGDEIHVYGPRAIDAIKP